jgi:hypothetical protein
MDVMAQEGELNCVTDVRDDFLLAMNRNGHG